MWISTTARELMPVMTHRNVGHGRDAWAQPGEVGDLVATPRRRMEPRQLAEGVAGGVE
jgi:hypothetical protein